MKTLYIVYGKHKEMKRFRPMDMKENDFVLNKIHASTFTETELTALEKEVEYMNRKNSHYTFEIRKS